MIPSSHNFNSSIRSVEPLYQHQQQLLLLSQQGNNNNNNSFGDGDNVSNNPTSFNNVGNNVVFHNNNLNSNLNDGNHHQHHDPRYFHRGELTRVSPRGPTTAGTTAYLSSSFSTAAGITPHFSGGGQEQVAAEEEEKWIELQHRQQLQLLQLQQQEQQLLQQQQQQRNCFGIANTFGSNHTTGDTSSSSPLTFHGLNQRTTFGDSVNNNNNNSGGRGGFFSISSNNPYTVDHHHHQSIYRHPPSGTNRTTPNDSIDDDDSSSIDDTSSHNHRQFSFFGSRRRLPFRRHRYYGSEFMTSPTTAAEEKSAGGLPPNSTSTMTAASDPATAGSGGSRRMDDVMYESTADGDIAVVQPSFDEGQQHQHQKHQHSTPQPPHDGRSPGAMSATSASSSRRRRDEDGDVRSPPSYHNNNSNSNNTETGSETAPPTLQSSSSRRRRGGGGGGHHVRNLSEHFEDATKLHSPHHGNGHDEELVTVRERKDDVPAGGSSGGLIVRTKGDDESATAAGAAAAVTTPVAASSPNGSGREMDTAAMTTTGQKHRRMYSGDVSNPALAHRRINSIGNSTTIQRGGGRGDHRRIDSSGLDALSAAADFQKELASVAAASSTAPSTEAGGVGRSPRSRQAGGVEVVTYDHSKGPAAIADGMRQQQQQGPTRSSPSATTTASFSTASAVPAHPPLAHPRHYASSAPSSAAAYYGYSPSHHRHHHHPYSSLYPPPTSSYYPPPSASPHSYPPQPSHHVGYHPGHPAHHPTPPPHHPAYPVQYARGGMPPPGVDPYGGKQPPHLAPLQQPILERPRSDGTTPGTLVRNSSPTMSSIDHGSGAATDNAAPLERNEEGVVVVAGIPVKTMTSTATNTTPVKKEVSDGPNGTMSPPEPVPPRSLRFTGSGGSTQGVQTYLTTIGVGDNSRTVHPSSGFTGGEHRPTSSISDSSILAAVTGHHRKLSSFSALAPILFGEPSEHPLKRGGSNTFGGPAGGPHHRANSSTLSFLNSLDLPLENPDAAFMRNLQAQTGSSPGGKLPPTSYILPGGTGVGAPKGAVAASAAAPSRGNGAPLATGGTSKRVRRKCTIAGCTNRVVQGGLCIAHGAKRKTCKHPGCVKHVKKAGFCSTHGPARKRCEAEGCSKVAVQGGRCIAHGAKKKLCLVKDCSKQAILGGMCKKHHDRAQETGQLPEGMDTVCKVIEPEETKKSKASKSTKKPSHQRGLSIFQEISADTVGDLLSGNAESAGGNPSSGPPADDAGKKRHRHRSTFSEQIEKVMI